MDREIGTNMLHYAMAAKKRAGSPLLRGLIGLRVPV